MNNDYEQRVIEFESARNEAIFKYFDARPQLQRTIEQERLFEAGFDRAWNHLKQQLEAVERERDRIMDIARAMLNSDTLEEILETTHE